MNVRKKYIWPSSSVLPVGLSGYLRYESPIVTDGRVTGWFTYFRPDRGFAMDMAGFAVNVRLLLERPGASFSNTLKRGYLETYLLSALTTMAELEPMADNCTKVTHYVETNSMYNICYSVTFRLQLE